MATASPRRMVGRLAEDYLATLATCWVRTSSTLVKQKLSRDECQHCHEKFKCRSALFAHMRSRRHFTLRLSRPGFSAYDRKHSSPVPYEAEAMELVSWILFAPLLSSAPRYWHSTAEADDELAASLLPDPTILTYRLDTGESILLLLVARAVAAAADPDPSLDPDRGGGGGVLRVQCLRMLRLGLRGRASRAKAFEPTASSTSERDQRDMWAGLRALSTVEERVFASAASVARDARDEEVLHLLIGVDGLQPDLRRKFNEQTLKDLLYHHGHFGMRQLR